MEFPLEIQARMADGSTFIEHADDFAQFVAIVLPLRRDSECAYVVWNPVAVLARRRLLASIRPYGFVHRSLPETKKRPGTAMVPGLLLRAAETAKAQPSSCQPGSQAAR